MGPFQVAQLYGHPSLKKSRLLQVIRAMKTEDTIESAFAWSLTLIAKIMVTWYRLPKDQEGRRVNVVSWDHLFETDVTYCYIMTLEIIVLKHMSFLFYFGIMF